MRERNPDGTYDGVSIMSRISGLPKDSIKDIWNQVKDNHKRLDECPGPHDFQPIQDSSKTPQRYCCSICKGEEDSIHVRWYKKGIEHGSRT